jgi:hypothetical protein
MMEAMELKFEELEPVEDLGAFAEFMDGVRKGIGVGVGVVGILAIVGIT